MAIKAPFSLTIAYRGANDDAALDRVVEPYGMLLGIRQYLIARDLGNGRAFRRFRLDRITGAKITGQSFAREPDLDLDAYAAQSFGSYHTEVEHKPVIWRFAPSAAAAAREFAFHLGAHRRARRRAACCVHRQRLGRDGVASLPVGR